MIDFLTIIFVIFLFFLISLPIGFCVYIVYSIFTFLVKRFSRDRIICDILIKKIKYSCIILTFLIAGYETYTSFYPTDSFYFDEFRTVTLREPPASSEIIKKESTYPDLHGDYSSSCQIVLSKSDFLKLFKSISNDKRLVRQKINDYKFENKIIVGIFRRIKIGKDDQFLYITFLDDKRTIIIDIDVT